MKKIIAIIVVVIVVAALGWFAYDRLMGRDLPTYATAEDHFLHGSIGNEGEQGLPYPIWAVLPDVFPQYMPGPGGYTAFGFTWKTGSTDDAPIGFSKARVGVTRIAVNCAVCHTSTIRMTADGDRIVIPGGPPSRVNVQGYQRFLAAAASDPRFTPDVLLPAMQARFHLSVLDRLTYRFLLIPFTKKALLKQRDAFAWTNSRPAWGPGRIDPFNPVKFGMLALPDDGTIGNSDMQPVWNVAQREAIRPNGPFHWDGLNTSFHEVVVSSALGDGSSAKEFNWPSMQRIEAYLRQLKPPASPYHPDPAAVARGETVFAANCAQCHAESGQRVLSVVPIAEVGTDPHRAAMWTDASRDAYNNYRTGYDWKFKSFRNIEGYIAEPLWGLWATGPYLHNGSVPTLSDLLTPPANRPAAFVRGVDVVDPVHGGMLAPACTPGVKLAEGVCYDTHEAGNSNAGHVYGTTLPAPQKADLLAYLLTR